MDLKITLHQAYMQLVQATSSNDRFSAAAALREALSAFADQPRVVPLPDPAPVLKRDGQALTAAGDRLDELDDASLRVFNLLLPWAAMTIDRRGRTVGGAWSETKRMAFNALIDRRLIAFDVQCPLRDQDVLEMGCFEGIHTLGCLLLDARVTGVDGRVENILKTLARLWVYGRTTPLVLWNLEQAPPASLPSSWDVLHHVGVLYHLSNPVEHLEVVLPATRRAVILDTHVARDDEDAAAVYEVAGRTYRYRRYGEAQVDVSPFAGMTDHAKWLRVDDLLAVCRRHGFEDARLVEDRSERNGRRVLIWAFK